MSGALPRHTYQLIHPAAAPVDHRYRLRLVAPERNSFAQVAKLTAVRSRACQLDRLYPQPGGDLTQRQSAPGGERSTAVRPGIARARRDLHLRPFGRPGRERHRDRRTVAQRLRKRPVECHTLRAAGIVVMSRGGIAQGAQLGQRVAVFGSVGVLLGRDDVLQSRRPDRETGPSDDRCSRDQVLVGQQTAVGACEA